MYLLTIYHYSTIYRFSAATAAESTVQSDSVVLRLVNAATVLFGISADRTILWDAEFIVRKLAHFTIFFILGFLLTMLSQTDKRAGLCKCAARALLCGLFGAAFDECHQYFVPGRSAEVRDICIDFLGVLTGCTVFCAMRRILVGDDRV